jgi:DNA-binding HxlR family transcriptional regulator
MLPSTYEDQNCTIARALEIVGERWTLLVIRDALLGIRRFEDFQSRLGVSRAVLSDRLSQLVQDGILQRVRYQDRPARHEYVLTDRGEALWPAITALWQWGAALTPEGTPRRFRHRGCSSSIDAEVRCTDCGQVLTPEDVLTSQADGVPVTRAEHVAEPVLSELSRERPLLAPMRG